MLADVDAAHRHSDRSPSRNSPEEQLNVKKALQIVSEHYGKRKATFRFPTMHWCQVVQHQLMLPPLICRADLHRFAGTLQVVCTSKHNFLVC